MEEDPYLAQVARGSVAISDSGTEPAESDPYLDQLRRGMEGGLRPDQEGASRAQRAGLSAGRSAEEHESYLKQGGFSAEAIPGLMQEYRLGQERERLKTTNRYGTKETYLGGVREQIARHSIPFSDIIPGNFIGKPTAATEEAKKRYNAGEATMDDLRLIAEEERLGEIDERMQKSTAGKMVSVMGSAPKVLGEFGAGTKVLKGAGRALGLGKTAPPISLSGAFSPQAARAALRNPSWARGVATEGGRLAILGEIAPSMWVQEAQENNISVGRNPNDWRGYPPAMAHAAINMMVLGQLQKNLGIQSPLGSATVKGGLFAVEQAAADALTNLVSTALPKGYKINSKYGTFENLMSGKSGEALQHAAVDAFTGALFGGIHDLKMNRPSKADQRVDRVMNGFAADLAQLHQSGRSADGAGREMQRMSATVRALAIEPQMTLKLLGLQEAAKKDTSDVGKARVEMIEQKLQELFADLGSPEARQAAVEAIRDARNAVLDAPFVKSLERSSFERRQREVQKDLEPEYELVRDIWKDKAARAILEAGIRLQPRPITAAQVLEKLNLPGTKKKSTLATRIAESLREAEQFDTRPLEERMDEAAIKAGKFEGPLRERMGSAMRQASLFEPAAEGPPRSFQERARGVLDRAENFNLPDGRLEAPETPTDRLTDTPRGPEGPPEAPGGSPVPREPNPPVPPSEGGIAPPAKAGEADPANIERYYRTPGSKGPADNVDAVISELVGNTFAGKWFSRTREGNEGYFQVGRAQLEFRNDRLGAEGDVVERGERDVLIGGKAPMYMHPALSAIRFRGKADSPQFEKLRRLVEDVNGERVQQGLDPIEIEATERGSPPPETPVPPSTPPATPRAGTARAAAGDRAFGEGPKGEPIKALPEHAEALNELSARSITRKQLQEQGYVSLQKKKDLFEYGYSISLWVKPKVPESMVVEFNPRPHNGRPSQLPRVVIDNLADQQLVHRAIGAPMGEVGPQTGRKAKPGGKRAPTPEQMEGAAGRAIANDVKAARQKKPPLPPDSGPTGTNPPPEAPNFKRTTPREGTKERTESDARWEDLLKRREKIDEKISDARKRRDKARWGSKASEKAEKDLDKAKAELEALDAQSKAESRRKQHAEDVVEKGDAANRIAALGELGFIEPNAVYPKLMELGIAEARRQGLHGEENLKIVAQDAASMIRSYFATDKPLSTYIRNGIDRMRREETLRDALSRLDEFTDLPATEARDFRARIKNAEYEPETIKEILDNAYARNEIVAKEKAEFDAQQDKAAREMAERDAFSEDVQNAGVKPLSQKQFAKKATKELHRFSAVASAQKLGWATDSKIAYLIPEKEKAAWKILDPGEGKTVPILDIIEKTKKNNLPLQVKGWRNLKAQDKDAGPEYLLVGPEGQQVRVDAQLFETVRSRYPNAEIFGTEKGESPIIFRLGNKPVGLIMPFGEGKDHRVPHVLKPARKASGPGPKALTPKMAKEVWSGMDAAERDSIPADMREILFNAMKRGGFDPAKIKLPTKVGDDRRQKGDDLPIDAGVEATIDASDLTPNRKAGVKKLMEGASTRVAEEAAKGEVTYETLRTDAKKVLGEPAVDAMERAAADRLRARMERQTQETEVMDPISGNIIKIRHKPRQSELKTFLTEEGGFLNLPVFERYLSQFGSWVKRMFTSPGHLPRSVFQEKGTMEGQIQAHANDVVNAAKDLRKAVGGRWETVSDADLKRMNDALGGDQRAMRSLPPETQAALKVMRDQIDALSRALVNSGAAQGKVAGAIGKNIGMYLTRQYRVFTDPRWHEHVEDAVKNRFKSWLRAEIIRTQNRVPTPEELDGTMKKFLFNETAAENPIAFISKSKLGSKDLAILKNRKEIPKELRELWGEFQDPIVNYANSVARMAHLLSNHQFLLRARDLGLRNGFFTLDATPENFVEIAPKTSEVMSPLAGLHTTPEIKKAFEEIYAKEAIPDYVRGYMKVLALTKYGKTVGSPVTHLRNTLGNVGFMIANGHFRAQNLWPAIKSLLDGTPAGRARWRRYLELGVVGEGVHENEFKAVGKDALDLRDLAGMSYAHTAQTRVGRWVRGGFDLLTKTYRAEDALAKIYAFENEVSRYKEAHPNWTPAQVEAKAAEIVKLTYPTYSHVPAALKWLRKFPLTGSFVSFPSEVARTTYHTARLAITEMRDPATRQIGATRMAGLVASLGMAAGLAMTMRALLGIDHDEETDLRRFLPEWTRDSQLLPLGRDDKGNRLYVDMGRTDPHAFLIDPLQAAFGGGEAGRDRFFSFRNPALQPFIGEEVGVRPLLNIARNKDEQTGKQIYNPEGGTLGQGYDVLGHFLKAVAPGAWTDLRRLGMAAFGVKEQNGREYGLDREIIKDVSGQYVQAIEVEKGFGFKAKSYDTALRDAENLFLETARRRDDVTPDMLQSAYAESEAQRKRVFEEFREDLLAAERLGLDKGKIVRILKDSGIAKPDIGQLMSGRYVPNVPVAPKGLPPGEGQKRVAAGMKGAKKKGEGGIFSLSGER